MKDLLKLLRQRRIWSMIVAVATVILGWLSLDYIPEPEILTDMLANMGVMAAKFIEIGGAFISGALALWSYLRPKKT